MDKERIYYGELVPLTDGEPARIPAIVLVSGETKENCNLPEKAEEILVFCKDGRPLYPGSLTASRLIREEDVVSFGGLFGAVFITLFDGTFGLR